MVVGIPGDTQFNVMNHIHVIPSPDHPGPESLGQGSGGFLISPIGFDGLINSTWDCEEPLEYYEPCSHRPESLYYTSL